MLYLPFVDHVLACILRKTCFYENSSIRNTIHDFPNINFLSFSINFRPFVCYIFPENYHPEFIRPKTATIWSIYGDFRTFPRCLGEVVWRRSYHLRLVHLFRKFLVASYHTVIGSDKYWQPITVSVGILVVCLSCDFINVHGEVHESKISCHLFYFYRSTAKMTIELFNNLCDST